MQATGYSAPPRRLRMCKSIIRLRPILSAPSNSSARPFRTCGSRAAGALFKFHPKGARSRVPRLQLVSYHATKWGIEGFIESAAQEVAPFGIDFIIVEPGPTATNFGAGLVHASPMAIYNDTPAGAV